MKKRHILTVIAVGAFMAATIGAQNKLARKHEVVILRGLELQYYLNQNLPDRCGDGYAYAGIVAENASFSEGADKFSLPFHYSAQPCAGQSNTVYVALAEKVAGYLDQGYVITHQDKFTVWMIKGLATK